MTARVARVMGDGAVAVTATATAAVVTWTVEHLAQDTTYVFFVAAVAVVAHRRGIVAGLASIALCILAAVSLFIVPSGAGSSRPAWELMKLASFAAVGALMLWLTTACRTNCGRR